MPDTISQDPTSTDSVDIGSQISDVIDSIALAAPAIGATVVTDLNASKNSSLAINPRTGLAYNTTVYPGAGLGGIGTGAIGMNSGIWLILLAVIFLVVVEK